jgi:hypothetical protein
MLQVLPKPPTISLPLPHEAALKAFKTSNADSLDKNTKDIAAAKIEAANNEGAIKAVKISAAGSFDKPGKDTAVQNLQDLQCPDF